MKLLILTQPPAKTLVNQVVLTWNAVSSESEELTGTEGRRSLHKGPETGHDASKR